MSSSPPPPPQPPTVAIPPPHTEAIPLPEPQPTVTVTATAVALPRKFPAPCWSQEETLALINCYQDKWYSLRRRNLRTADWEAVAEEVAIRCPNQLPAKTSAQCRHKMEKLRKRYRTEKQRIMSLPNNGNGRFYGSPWVFFDLIDSMESGSGVPNNTNMNTSMNNVISNNLQVSNVSKVDLEVKPFSMNKNNTDMNMNTNTNINSHMNVNLKRNNINDVNLNDGNVKKGDLGKYFDEMMLGMNNNNNNNKGKIQNHEFDVRSPAPHIKFKVKNHHQHNHRVGYAAAGGDLNNDFDDTDDYSGGGFYMQPASGHKRKLANYEMMPVNGNVSSSRKDYENGSRERDREKGSVVGEMVASIKMLGEGLVKMEKMKIEMMRDIEKMRMEMELKRSEMILESQHLIVNAFVQGLKKHNNKVKVTEIE